ncbi:MAG: hypothetical protein J6X42_00180, partial [Alphaproteobacteria bacterium]|nr:hypothetical protein [Alphaproteobacteria bacterium]
IESIGIDAFTQSRANVVIYCEDTTEGRCADLINANNSSDIDKLVHFTTGEDGVYYTEDGKYFASTLLMQQGKECDSQQICQEIVAADKSGQAFFMDGKFYASLDDWAKNKSIKKRIYTIDEANKVTGVRNRVTIRYR